MNTNIVKTLTLGIAVSASAMLSSCDRKENAQLKARVDSLKVELQASQQTASALQDVGVLLDSIDASRQMLRSNMVEGTSYADYKTRLSNLNNYIKETRTKIDGLEKSLKKSNANYATIKRLKSELENSTQQIAMLQQEAEKMRAENTSLSRTVSQRDSTLAERAEFIKVKEQDIATMEAKVNEITEKSKNDQANLYFAQAQALETAAMRTKFAPRKKKETQREALELYKMALSLGKTEAQGKIDELEKIIG